MKTTLLTLAVLSALALLPALAEDSRPAYKNPDLPVEQRVADLLKRMTIEEKAAQLCTAWELKAIADAQDKFDPAKAEKVFANGLGGFGPVRWSIAKEVEFRNAAQKFVLEHTRLGIPIIFHEEGCHGVLAPEANSFPVPIGIACSWDEEMIERVFTTVGAELRSRGVHQALTPILDICRDPRWGRTDEMLGEDPYLNGKLGAAMVRGFQGREIAKIGDGHVAATLKHLTGHGQPEAGVNRAPAHLGRRELFESHLVPFEMVLAATKPACVMPSYNEIDGVPSHINHWLLQDVLRKQFDFNGLITSDYLGIDELEKFHHVAGNLADAALLAFKAGVDMDLPEGKNYAKLPELVRAGKIPESALDASVVRVLRLKFELGLFEKSSADATAAASLMKREATKALALEAAHKSIVLLKNKDSLLPLTKGAHKTIAVVGPHSNDTRLGSYSGEPPYRVSILDGIMRAVGYAAKVVHAKGCSITTNEGPSPMLAWNKVDRQEYPTAEADKADIAEAVKVAQEADLIVLVLGENELICRESWSREHVGDRDSLDLFGRQHELADAMFNLGKPVVVYLMNGRPLAIPHVVEKAAAVLEGWYMGQETGNAAADILFGSVNPSGKLTITFPRDAGQLPMFYNHKPLSRGYPYVNANNKPLFPFGFGLSYTTFSYSEPQLSAPEMKPDGKVEVSVTVTNTGKVAGDEIVQLYVHDKVASVTRPVRELKGFRRVSLAPGKSESVSFSITPDMLAFYDADMKRVIEPGEFEFTVGPSSTEGKTATLRVVE